MTVADLLLHHRVEQFFFHEARLLDEGLFDEWLTLFDDDARYWMPTRETRTSHAAGIRKEGELPLFEDDKTFLAARVKRINSGLAHAEQPPSRTRHFISNVQVAAAQSDEIQSRCCIMVFQSRLEQSECTFVGFREDVIRIVGDRWLIRRRKVVLDQPILPRSISIFF